jgi:hypothetical protein
MFAINGNSPGSAELNFVEVAGETGVPLRADFTPLGSDQVLVQVCIDGVCVGEYVAGAGEVGRIRHASIANFDLLAMGGSALTNVPGSGTATPAYFFKFDRSVEVIPPGAAPGSGIVGREVRVSSTRTLVTVQALARLRVNVTGVAEFDVTGVVRSNFADYLTANFTSLQIEQLIAANFDLDLDRDGANEIHEFTRGTSPLRWDPGEYSPSSNVRDGADGLPHLRWSYVLAPVSGVEVRMWSSVDLRTFDEDPSQWTLVGREPLPGGRVRLIWEMNEPVGGLAGDKPRKHHGHVTVLK